MYPTSGTYHTCIETAIKTSEMDGDKTFLEVKACITRHCMNELQEMLKVSNGRTIQKSINSAQTTLRISLNCILMMNYYKNFNYRIAYRAHKRTTKLLHRPSNLPWLDKFKQALDTDMTVPDAKSSCFTGMKKSLRRTTRATFGNQGEPKYPNHLC